MSGAGACWELDDLDVAILRLVQQGKVAVFDDPETGEERVYLRAKHAPPAGVRTLSVVELAARRLEAQARTLRAVLGEWIVDEDCAGGAR